MTATETTPQALTFVKGSALFAKLTEPDYKFKELGEYGIALLMDADEAAPFVEILDRMFEENLAYQQEVHGKRKAPASKHRGYVEEYERDADGKETDTPTGKIMFKFKHPHQVKRRKDGKIITIKPVAVFDAQGKGCMGTEIGNGSIVSVRAEARGWYNTSLGCGVKLDVSAVQINQLREGGGGESFEDSGFAVDEDGYTAAPGDIAGNATAPGAPVDDNGGDF